MSSVRELKKAIHHTFGDIIEACYEWEFSDSNNDTKKSQKIIDKTLSFFDDLMDKIHNKDISDPKKHFNSIKKELDEKAVMLNNELKKLA